MGILIVGVVDGGFARDTKTGEVWSPFSIVRLKPEITFLYTSDAKGSFGTIYSLLGTNSINKMAVQCNTSSGWSLLF